MVGISEEGYRRWSSQARKKWKATKEVWAYSDWRHALHEPQKDSSELH